MQNFRIQKSKNKSDLERLLAFQSATRYGPIFICSSCDQKMFQNNVVELDDNIINKIKSQSLDLYDKVLANNIQEIVLHTKEGKKDPKISISA